MQQNFPRCRGRCFSTSLFGYKLRMCAYDVRSLFTSAARHRQLLLPEPVVCQPTRTRHCLNPEMWSWAVSYLWPSRWIHSVGRCFSLPEKVKEFARRKIFWHMWVSERTMFQMHFHILQSCHALWHVGNDMCPFFLCGVDNNQMCDTSSTEWHCFLMWETEAVNRCALHVWSNCENMLLNLPLWHLSCI